MQTIQHDNQQWVRMSDVELEVHAAGMVRTYNVGLPPGDQPMDIASAKNLAREGIGSRVQTIGGILYRTVDWSPVCPTCGQYARDHATGKVCVSQMTT